MGVGSQLDIITNTYTTSWPVFVRAFEQAEQQQQELCANTIPSPRQVDQLLRYVTSSDRLPTKGQLLRMGNLKIHGFVPQNPPNRAQADVKQMGFGQIVLTPIQNKLECFL